MPAVAVAAGLALASAYAGYEGKQKAAQGQQDAANAYAQQIAGVPMYGPGEKQTKYAAEFLRKKYGNQQATSDIPSYQNLLADPTYGNVMGQIGTGRGSVYVAPQAQAAAQEFSDAGKQFNTDQGANHGQLAAGDSINQQQQKTAFKSWQNQGYGQALGMGNGGFNAGPANYLAQQFSALPGLIDQWKNAGSGAAPHMYDAPIGPGTFDPNDLPGGLV